MLFAVIDTNVLVSALITHNAKAATVSVVKSIFLNKIIPLYNEEILNEYDNVLHRAKFKLSDAEIKPLIDTIKMYGKDTARIPFDSDMLDESDRVFYEVSLSEEYSFLVTGNLKHFPRTPKVVTAAQMMEIIERKEQNDE